MKRLAGETQVLANRHLDRLKKGGIEGACAVLWVDPPYTERYEQYVHRTEQLLWATKAELAECQGAVMVHNLAEIEAAKAAGKFYLLLGAEGLSAIGGSTEKLDKLYDFGLRHAMLTWNEENDLASGAQGNPDHGVTATGKKILRHMEAKHMLIDVSHINEKSFWDVMDTVSCPVIASHSSARALGNHPRNLYDDQLRAIAESGGIVGVNAFYEFLSDDPAERNIDRLVEHISYMAEKIGVDHLALGFDFCEFLPDITTDTFSCGAAMVTEGLASCLDVPVLLEKIRAAGFSVDDIDKISYKNWHRVIGEVLG